MCVGVSLFTAYEFIYAVCITLHCLRAVFMCALLLTDIQQVGTHSVACVLVVGFCVWMCKEMCVYWYDLMGICVSVSLNPLYDLCLTFALCVFLCLLPCCPCVCRTSLSLPSRLWQRRSMPSWKPSHSEMGARQRPIVPYIPPLPLPPNPTANHPISVPLAYTQTE